MSLLSAPLFASLAALAMGVVVAPGPVLAEEARTKLVIGTQDVGFPAIVAASGALDEASFEVEWAVLVGPQPQLAALHSKSVDIAWLGDMSILLEQARSETDWTAENAPFRIVAAWRNDEPEFRKVSDVTAVRASSGIESLADLRGKSWAVNYGGVNHLVYALTLLEAGLRPEDVDTVILGDGHQAAAAFNAGQTEVYSGDYVRVKEAIDSGAGRVLIDSDTLDIPGLTVFAARRDVIEDEVKSAALDDFVTRLDHVWDWYGANPASVADIYVTEAKFEPDRASAQTARNKAALQPIDDLLLRRQQEIADILFANEIIPKKIDVSLGYLKGRAGN